MRIFHGPSNIGGMAGELARAQREAGHDALAYCYPSRTYGYIRDNPWPPSRLAPKASTTWFIRNRATSFDVFQFYFGTSLTGADLKDVEVLKSAGKKVFFYFCGCDVRDSKLTVAKYQYSACKECWPMGCSPNREHAIRIATTVADGAFVSTPDLIEFVPGAKLLPQPVRCGELASKTRSFEKHRRTTEQPYVVVHAPSDRQKKGTRYVIDAVASLKRRGLPIELRLLEGMPHEATLEAIRGADIVIDQLLIGAYGLLSVEAMAVGKPVICYMREDLLNAYPARPPILSADPHSVENVLAQLLSDSTRMSELRASGPGYVRRWHDSKAVASTLLSAYAQ